MSVDAEARLNQTGENRSQPVLETCCFSPSSSSSASGIRLLARRNRPVAGNRGDKAPDISESQVHPAFKMR